MKFRKTGLSLFALRVLLVALLIDIGGGLGVKYVAFVLVFFVCLHKLIADGASRLWWPEAIVLIYFLAAGMVSIATGSAPGAVYDQLSFVAFFMLIVLLRGVQPREISHTLLHVIFLGAIAVIGFYLLLYFTPDLALPLAEAGAANGLGYLGYRAGFIGLPNVYFRWSVWLVMGMALALASRSLVPIAVVGLAGILTTSTAIIGMLFVTVASYLVLVQRGVRGLFSTLLAGCVLCLIVIGYFSLDSNMAGFVASKFSPESESTAVKLGHIESVLNVLGHNWLVTLFGQGVGTSFFSVGVDHEVLEIETSHFNVLRQFGVLGLTIVTTYMIFTVLQIARFGNVGKAWAIGLVSMFVVAGTNPLLLSPMFFVPLLMARAYVLERQKRDVYAR